MRFIALRITLNGRAARAATGRHVQAASLHHAYPYGKGELDRNGRSCGTAAGISAAKDNTENSAKSSNLKAPRTHPPSFVRLGLTPASRVGGLAVALKDSRIAWIGERFFKKMTGLVKLACQLPGRTLQIVPPCSRRARISRIGEVSYIGYSGSLLLQSDFTVEFPRHLGKLGDHRFDLRDAASRLVDLKAPETCK